ncbi:MAG: GNAT family N-acetyltransferase [Phycisphaerales bacterium JB043]
MSPACVIELVTTETVDEVVALFVGYLSFYNQHRDDDGPVRDFLRARVERGESMIFLARVGGVPAGFTQVYPTFTSVRLGEALELNDLFVHEDFRRMGIGRALCERVIELGRERGSSKISLKTENTNTDAQKLYELLGFAREDRFYSYNFWL